MIASRASSVLASRRPVAARGILWATTLTALLVSACGARRTNVEEPSGGATGPLSEAPADEAPPRDPSASRASDDALGGRLFDRFYDGKRFSPARGDSDGVGGPFGNGRLPNAAGEPLANTGHDYRLKNLFGWDLRGARGIYGPDYHKKSYVSERDLLDESLTSEEVVALLRDGTAELPAYGKVLDEDEFGALAAFVTGVREGRLPRADQFFTLSRDTPGNYRLVEGGDPERGKQLFADRCAGCHGEDGTKMLLDDDAYSLGSHARQKAYEDWFKILNGQPNTSMKRMVRGENAAELRQEVLDLLAALCDRTAFPVGGATAPDVPDGDPRCGAYLR